MLNNINAKVSYFKENIKENIEQLGFGYDSHPKDGRYMVLGGSGNGGPISSPEMLVDCKEPRFPRTLGVRSHVLGKKHSIGMWIGIVIKTF